MAGRETEANALLEAAGKDLQDFIANNELGYRTSQRLQSSSWMFIDSANTLDMNIKRKMMMSRKNRMMRDRQDPNDKDQI
jgi:GTP-sensing pleiotropic transcriptional regulator CodY